MIPVPQHIILRFYMRPRISIWGLVRPSVRWSIDWSVNHTFFSRQNRKLWPFYYSLALTQITKLPFHIATILHCFHFTCISIRRIVSSPLVGLLESWSVSLFFTVVVENAKIMNDWPILGPAHSSSALTLKLLAPPPTPQHPPPKAILTPLPTPH